MSQLIVTKRERKIIGSVACLSSAILESDRLINRPRVSAGLSRTMVSSPKHKANVRMIVIFAVTIKNFT